MFQLISVAFQVDIQRSEVAVHFHSKGTQYIRKINLNCGRKDQDV